MHREVGRGRHNSAWGKVYGGKHMQVKAHAHVQAEVEQVEAGAYGEWAWWESRGRQVHMGDSGQRHRWASGMNLNNREISMSTKKKRG